MPRSAFPVRLEESRLWVGQVHWGSGLSSCGGGTTASTTQPQPSMCQRPPGVSKLLHTVNLKHLTAAFLELLRRFVCCSVTWRASHWASELIEVVNLCWTSPLPPREPQRCVCWCWLQRHSPLPLLGCCQQGTGPRWLPGWFGGEDEMMTAVFVTRTQQMVTRRRRWGRGQDSLGTRLSFALKIFLTRPLWTESSRVLRLRPPCLRTQPHGHRPDPGGVEADRRSHEGKKELFFRSRDGFGDVQLTIEFLKISLRLNFF